jgi:uncharacterized protein DUF6544
VTTPDSLSSSSQTSETAPSASALLQRIRNFAMPYGVPRCNQVFLRQVGEMRLGPDKPWLSFTAEQTLSAVFLDFRWQAHSRMFRFMPTTIIDAFEAQRGSLSVYVLGKFPIARFGGSAVDRGEVMRALAELPWRPFGFVEQTKVNWTIPETGRLRACYSADQIHAIVNFDVDPDGRVIGASAPDRPRAVGKTFVETPWSGLFSEWRFFDQVRVPVRAEVNWRLPEGPFCCWRAQIKEFRVITA